MNLVYLLCFVFLGEKNLENCPRLFCVFMWPVKTISFSYCVLNMVTAFIIHRNTPIVKGEASVIEIV